jgi:predicted nucleotidyltransferase
MGKLTENIIQIDIEKESKQQQLIFLFKLEKLFHSKSKNHVLTKITLNIPNVFHYSGLVRCEINYKDKVYQSPYFEKSNSFITADIRINGICKGEINIYYINNKQISFSDDEQDFLNTLTLRLSDFFQLQALSENNSAPKESHSEWRKKMAEKICEKMDFKKFGVKNVYLIGSTKNATAEHLSDIDLIIHIENTKASESLISWLEGWSFCLAEINYKRTNHQIKDGLLDIHYITDDDIKAQNSYAVMIGSLHNSATLIKTKENNE